MSLQEILGDSVITTKLRELVAWGQKSSLWPIPYATACCGIEYMSTVASASDISRFGSELVRFSPRQADLMIVLGTINYKQAPIIKRIYEQMCEPKWVVAAGACASTGGFYNNYSVLQGVDQIIPVDVYVPGCPPRPEGIMNAILRLREKITREAKEGISEKGVA